MHQKLVPYTFLILVNKSKQPLHAKNCFKNKKKKEDYQKTLQHLTLFYLLNPISFDEQDHQKQKGPEK